MADSLEMTFKDKGKSFGVAALLFITLGLVSCEHDIDSIVERESLPAQKHLLTISATLSAEINNSPTSRLILEDDKGSIKTRWEKEYDELILFLEHNSEQHIEVAHIKSLSSDARVAEFEIKIPEGWTGKCNIYGMLQKSRLPESGMLSEQDIARCKTLWNGQVIFRTAYNQCRFSAEFTSNPAFWFKQENIKITSHMNNVQIRLQHLGYLMAMHIKNSTANAINVPTVKLFTANHAPFFLSDGFEDVGFDVKTGECISVVWSGVLYFSQRSETLGMETSRQILPEGIITLYHWFPYNKREVPALNLVLEMEHPPYTCEGQLKKRSVQNGMVYHICLEYNGSQELRLLDQF